MWTLAALSHFIKNFMKKKNSCVRAFRASRASDCTQRGVARGFPALGPRIPALLGPNLEHWLRDWEETGTPNESQRERVHSNNSRLLVRVGGARGRLAVFPRFDLRGRSPGPSLLPYATPWGVRREKTGRVERTSHHKITWEPLFRLKSEVLPVSSQLSNCEQELRESQKSAHEGTRHGIPPAPLLPPPPPRPPRCSSELCCSWLPWRSATQVSGPAP